MSGLIENVSDSTGSETEKSSSLPKIGRRSFLAAAATAATAATSAAFGRDFGPNAPPVRYPDPDLIVLDDRFKKYKLGNTPIQRLYHSNKMLWAEGPAWNGVGRYLLWSDIPNNVQLRWMEEDGHVSTFRNPSGNSNGNTFDFRGRQISCEHGNRRVVRYEYNGKISVLADGWQGKRLKFSLQMMHVKFEANLVTPFSSEPGSLTGSVEFPVYTPKNQAARLMTQRIAGDSMRGSVSVPRRDLSGGGRK